MSKTQKVAELLKRGQSVYPANLRGLAARATPIKGRRDALPPLGVQTVEPIGAPSVMPEPTNPTGAGLTVTNYQTTTRRVAAFPNERAARQFVTWVAREFPKLYNAAEARASGRTLGGLRGLGADTTAATTGGAFSTLVDTITKLAPDYLQYKAQKDLLSAQLDRARAGLPPLNPTDYAPAVQVSLDPTQTSAAASAAWESAKPFLMWGGLGLLGFVLVNSMGRRRRR